jgi:hypothetical protein
MIGWIAVGQTNPGYFQDHFIRQRGLPECGLGQSSRHPGFEFIVEFDSSQILIGDSHNSLFSSPMASATRFLSFSGAPTFQIQM